MRYQATHLTSPLPVPAARNIPPAAEANEAGWEKNVFADTFKEVDSKLRADRHINSAEGGTTATVVLFENDKNMLTVAHVGDTRAVMGRRNAMGMRGVDLTEDHKPDSIKEKKRIERMGGKVIEASPTATATRHPTPDTRHPNSRAARMA